MRHNLEIKMNETFNERYMTIASDAIGNRSHGDPPSPGHVQTCSLYRPDSWQAGSWHSTGIPSCPQRHFGGGGGAVT